MSVDYPELNLCQFDQEVVLHLQKSSGRIRYAAENALDHLVKAMKIAEIDPEMAAFRALTAEEEAATSLFFALKKINYENSNLIKFKEHKFKFALYPFLVAVHHRIDEFLPKGFPAFKLIWEDLSGEKKIRLEINLPGSDGSFSPDMPLNFALNKSGKPVHFEEQISKLSQNIGKKKALDYIKEIANQRNMLLYAGDRGRAALGDDISGIIEMQKRKTLVILRIVCLFLPYKEHALFVQQCLNGYLLMMEKIDKEELEI